MSQRQQLERIMEIDRRIRNGEYPNADRLAELLEVSRRVVFNDRDFMINRMGAPIAYDRNRMGWYYTDRTWPLPGMIVTEGELLAFFLSVEISKRYLGSAMESALRSAVEKISRGVKGPVSVDMDRLRSHYTFSGPALISTGEHILLDLHKAINNRNCVWMRYYSPGNDEHTERVVLPYHLQNIRGDWFLIAFDRLRNDFRTFLAGRIEEWKVLPERFERMESFSADEWVSKGFQAHRGGEVEEVSIRFNKKMAPFIRERKWHPTQRIEELEGGGLVLHITTAGMVEVKNWVLQYGAEAEVLKPVSLRDECILEIRKMAAVYGM